MMIVIKPWIINEQEDVSQEYLYNLGKLALTENYKEWERSRIQMSVFNNGEFYEH